MNNVPGCFRKKRLKMKRAMKAAYQGSGNGYYKCKKCQGWHLTTHPRNPSHTAKEKERT